MSETKRCPKGANCQYLLGPKRYCKYLHEPHEIPCDKGDKCSDSGCRFRHFRKSSKKKKSEDEHLPKKSEEKKSEGRSKKSEEHLPKVSEEHLPKVSEEHLPKVSEENLLNNFPKKDRRKPSLPDPKEAASTPCHFGNLCINRKCPYFHQNRFGESILVAIDPPQIPESEPIPSQVAESKPILPPIAESNPIPHQVVESNPILPSIAESNPIPSQVAESDPIPQIEKSVSNLPYVPDPVQVPKFKPDLPSIPESSLPKFKPERVRVTEFNPISSRAPEPKPRRIRTAISPSDVSAEVELANEESTSQSFASKLFDYINNLGKPASAEKADAKKQQRKEILGIVEEGKTRCDRLEVEMKLQASEFKDREDAVSRKIEEYVAELSKIDEEKRIALSKISEEIEEIKKNNQDLLRNLDYDYPEHINDFHSAINKTHHCYFRSKTGERRAMIEFCIVLPNDVELYGKKGKYLCGSFTPYQLIPEFVTKSSEPLTARIRLRNNPGGFGMNVNVKSDSLELSSGYVEGLTPQDRNPF